MLYRAGRYELAEKELVLALADDRNDPSAHALWAWCLTRRQRHEEATEHAQPLRL